MSLNVEILEQSFEAIRPRTLEFVTSFYDNLFTDYPQVKPYFANTAMSGQYQHLGNTLILVIENLRYPNVLAEALKAMGARHLTYGAVREHYPMVGAALLKTFELYLGDAWTAEVKQAWIDA